MATNLSVALAVFLSLVINASFVPTSSQTTNLSYWNPSNVFPFRYIMLAAHLVLDI